VLIAGIGVTAFFYRDQLREYVLPSDEIAEAKGNVPAAADSAAAEAVASAAMPMPVAPAPAAPETVASVPVRTPPAAAPVEPAAMVQAPAASPLRPRAERPRPAAPADRSPIVRSFPSTSPPTAKGEDCSPPYRLDSDGIKIYKVECL
jgi:hypothetical protein